jgi:hypothetical protein
MSRRAAVLTAAATVPALTFSGPKSLCRVIPLHIRSHPLAVSPRGPKVASATARFELSSRG